VFLLREKPAIWFILPVAGLILMKGAFSLRQLAALAEVPALGPIVLRHCLSTALPFRQVQFIRSTNIQIFITSSEMVIKIKFIMNSYPVATSDPADVSARM
jgi:hypothetical protein